MGYESILFDCDPKIRSIYTMVRRRLHMMEPGTLKTIRESKHLSLETAAAKSGESLDAIERWEHGIGVQSREYEAWLKNV